jgi:NAD(P)-dependent dehydrogenase (short-subunit alcohol dehydrogenase family)
MTRLGDLEGGLTRAGTMYGMHDRVVVITGGGNGIGQGTALLFSHEGARVVVVDIDEAAGNRTLNLITSEGGKAIFVRADVSRDDEVKAMVERVLQTYGHIDILFANAAIQLSKSVADTGEQEWDRLHAVLFLASDHAAFITGTSLIVDGGQLAHG